MPSHPNVPPSNQFEKKPSAVFDDSLSSIAANDPSGAQDDETSIKNPYTYQIKIVDKVLDQWGREES
jgi:hypothetical protein